MSGEAHPHAPPAAALSSRHIPVSYATADIPGTGGSLRERPEDFLVEEQPLYAPCGDGEHIYLFIEKRNLSTLRVVRILAGHFRVRDSAIGYAGLKDKRAVTRQVFSIHVPGRKLEDFPSLREERLTVLWADRHTNKLRRGHLAGNRFSIRIRGVDAAKVVHARRSLQRLAEVGVPNRIGEQRFGYMLRNHLIGRALVAENWAGAVDALLAPADHPGVNDGQAAGRALYARGEYAKAMHEFVKESRAERRVLGALANGANIKHAALSIEPAERSFFLAAFQSAVFNRVLDERVLAGALGSLVEGDLAFKHDNRAVFSVHRAELDDPSTAQRLARFQISPSGPMWGATMLRAGGHVDATEVAALAAFGITPERLAEAESRGVQLPGERRPLRVPLIDPAVEGGSDEHGQYVRCAFDLPRGAFATSVMQEIMKTDASQGPMDEEDE